MSEYKRFVAYFYEYIDGKKQKNAGFAKVELRDGLWRVLFRLTNAAAPLASVQVYGFVRESGYLLGFPLGVMNGNGGRERLATVDVDADEDSVMDGNGSRERLGENPPQEWAWSANEPVGAGKYTFDQLTGIYMQSSDRRIFATVWDDEPVDLSRFVLELPEPGKAASEDQPRSAARPSEILAEVLPEETPDVPVEAPAVGPLRQPEEAPRVPMEVPSVEPQQRPEEAPYVPAEVPSVEPQQQPEEAPYVPAEVPAVEPLQRPEEIPQPEAPYQQPYEEPAEQPQEFPDPSGHPLEEPTDFPAESPDRHTWEIPNSSPGEITQPEPLQVSPSGEITQPEQLQVSPPGEIIQPEQLQVSPPDEITQPASLQISSAESAEPLLFSRQHFRPFDDDEFTDCVQIRLCDLISLQQGGWQVGRNNFLQHGYHLYRHLLLGKTADGTYVLGVPSMFSSREEYFANTFGFDHFKLSGRLNCGRKFGYWCRTLKKEKESNCEGTALLK